MLFDSRWPSHALPVGLDCISDMLNTPMYISVLPQEARGLGQTIAVVHLSAKTDSFSRGRVQCLSLVSSIDSTFLSPYAAGG